jgi:competence protein ComEC
MVLLGVTFVAGALLPIAPLPTICALLGALFIVTTRWRVRRVLLALATCTLAASAWRAARSVDAHEGERRALLAALPAPTRCAAHARVIGSPVATHGTLRWDAELSELECDGARGPPPVTLRATLYGGPASLARGDALFIVAQLGSPQRLWNPATGDPRPGESRRNILLSGGVIDARTLWQARGWLAFIDRARAHVRQRIELTFVAGTSAMARALVLGEADLSDADDADFRASGLAHLLAVSGMHLVIVIAGSVRAVRALLLRVPWLATRLDVERLAAALGVPAAWAYAEFAGAGGSTLRAAWMMTAALLARAIGRRSSAARAFGLSLVAMEALDPLVIFDVSFLLSAAATAGLIALSRPLANQGERLFSGKTSRTLRWVWSTATSTLAATIPCTPILARFAPTVPLGGVLANLLAVPIGESLALPVCLLHALLAPVPSAERGSAAVASGALAVVRAIAHAFATSRWLLVSIPPPNAWQLGCVALSLLLVVASHPWRRELLFGLASVALIAEVDARQKGEPKLSLRATFLDVGQGDASLVDLPDGEAMLIDAGGLVGSPIDTGSRVVAPALRERRRANIAVVALSHPHPDHFGGMNTGLASVGVGALWDTGQGEQEGTGGGYATLLAEMRRRGVPVLRPFALCGPHEIGGARIEVLAPCPGPSPDRGPNDNSLVLRVVYGSRAFLFLGDAEHEEERDLVALGSAHLRADVLKVGHHGSGTSTTAALLAAVAPRDAVISAGVRNRFGHPHPATLATLSAAGVRVWRTDRDGAIIAWTDGTRLEVSNTAQ